MGMFVHISQWILAILLIASSLGVILARKPLYASLSFLLSLLILATFYSQLSAHFIAVMQILVYAGAILVIFIFVIVLFQDAHQQISKFESKSSPILLAIAGVAFALTLLSFGTNIVHLPVLKEHLNEFGTVQSLGQAIYADFFFPFEAIILLFLVAIVGALYIAKKEM